MPDPAAHLSNLDPESLRLLADARREANWRRWGPYLSERQWGTVREDYSATGDAWNYFPHDHARSRAYRWGEDGLLGLTDRQCRLCFAVALWNGRDPILKERLFGLSGPEGNHGEDVKESYFYIDATPTGSYLKALYKYPQAEFPYAWLVEENHRRGKHCPEFELLETGLFDDHRYFDVFVEYAKAGQNDVLIRITVHNRGPEPALLHLLPTFWFRNTWSWGCRHEGCWPKPWLRQIGPQAIEGLHVTLGRYQIFAGSGADEKAPTWLFTDNESDQQRLFGVPNPQPYVKDAFHEYVVRGQTAAVNPKREGTKAAAHYTHTIPAGGSWTTRLRFFDATEKPAADPLQAGFDATFADRAREADEFYKTKIPANLNDDSRRIARQAYAGLLWSRQYYQYIVADWLAGDPEQPAPPANRKAGRNSDWGHLFNRDIISMPDKWEYPWYAAWDLAFHMIPLAVIDPDAAKKQLVVFLREWYMHPNGQLPAYEFALSDVNPPVHAWACWRVYKMTGRPGHRDCDFLARTFQKLLMNFTWWVNRKDVRGKHLFSGGFLGLDNIGPFDRSKPLPSGETLDQADGTAWMAFYCLTMLAMALELAVEQPAYEDMASKFFEHFVAIADAMNTLGGTGLWDEQDGFYYDRLHVGGQMIHTRVRSVVGLIPLFAVEILDDAVINRLPEFRKRMLWFIENRRDLASHVAYMDAQDESANGKRLLAIPSRGRLERVLKYLLAENEFLSPFGVRSLSKYYESNPYTCGDTNHQVRYVPGDSDSNMFGGNSNWRGPVWFPVNYLLIESLERYHRFYGDTLKVECPTGSGQWMNLQQVAHELSHRLAKLFRADADGCRACHGPEGRFASDPYWRELILYHEFFHGDNGSGLGASHQTGWTALVTRVLESCSQAGR